MEAAPTEASLHHHSTVRMYRRIVVPAVLLALSATSVISFAADGWRDPSGRQWELVPIPDEWLVRWTADPATTGFAGLVTAADVELLRGFGPMTRTMVVRTSDPAPFEGSPLVESIVPVFRDEEGFRKFLLPGRITLQFQSSVDPAEAEAQILASGSSILRRYQTRGYYQVSIAGGESRQGLPPEDLPGGRTDPARERTVPDPAITETALESVFLALREWSSHPDIRFAEPVYLGFDDALLATPNDPFFSNQWGLRNPGNGAWRATADVWADGAWWLSRGSADVVIAIIDTGMDMAHEDLVGSLLPQNGEDWDFLDPDNLPQDLDNHGTLVSGIASGVQGNAIGVSGFAPGCRIMPLRVSLNEGEIAERVDAIQYCASRRNEFDGLIVNCSWGNSSGDFTSVRLAIQDAVQAGCVVVCAAGNSNNGVIYPARYPEPIAVGATSPCDERKRPGSCDGESWGSCFGPELDVVAPGVRIWTTDRTGNLGLSTNNYWGFFNGTSAATPFVSALCALVQSVAPSLTPAEIQDILEQSADDQVGYPPEDTPGFDVYMGWGRINGWKALVLATHPDGIVDDIESPDPFWRHESLGAGGADPWHVSDFENRTENGSQCWSGADETGGTYLPATDAALYLPDVWVPLDGELVFWHRMDAFAFTAGIAGDGGLLEASTDGGESWFGLEPDDGYTHTVENLGGDPFEFGREVFSGSFDWRRESVDLATFAGAPIRIRFRFGSRSGALIEELGSGWRLDDFSVAPRDVSAVTELPQETPGLGLVLEGLPALYRPGSGVRFTLTRPSEVVASLFSAAGRRFAVESLGSLPAGSHEFGLDELLSSAASGSYWVRLHSDLGEAAGRIVVVE